MFVERLGLVIGARRRELGITQADVAKSAGLHKMAVSKIERGVHGDLGCLTLWRIARALKTRGHILYAQAETVVSEE